jgi:hypothetical protein
MRVLVASGVDCDRRGGSLPLPCTGSRASQVRTLARRVRTVIGILGLVAACTRADAKAKLDPPPAELLATAAIGPVTTLRNLQAYVEAIQPGAGAIFTDQVVRRGLAEMVGASSLDGLDPASWAYVLVASTEGAGAPAVALLGKVRDARTLATSAGSTHVMLKGGWAVLGAKPLLERIGAYALAAIAAQPAPAAPTVTVYLPHVLARYKAEIGAFRTQLMASLPQATPGPMGQWMTSYFEGLGSLGSDIEKLVVTLDATPELGSIDVGLVPAPRSRLATFVTLQRPTDYALLDRLPATAPSVLLGGHLEAGPYSDGFMAMMAAMFGPAATKELLASLEAFRKAMTGDIAMAMRIAPGTGMAFTQLYGLSDPRAADQAVRSMLELFKAGRTLDTTNLSTTIKTSPDTTAYDGVTLRSYDTTFDLSKVPAAQRQTVESLTPGGQQRSYIATFDALGMLVAAPEGLPEAKRSIDAARGKTARLVPGAVLGELLTASRARKDSLAMMLDLGAVIAAATGKPAATAQPVVVALGFADRNAHVRVALPAATLRAAMTAAKP